MQLKQLAATVERALAAEHDAISQYIADVEVKGRTTHIEKTFADAVHRQMDHLTILKERPLSDIGAESYWDGRAGGRIDSLITDRLVPSKRVAIEYKAIRLPRRISPGVGGARYDIGQLVGDYLRLSRAKALDAGFVIAFTYGPLASDAASGGALYRYFHNQMFVDLSVAVGDGQYSESDEVMTAFDELEWLKPYSRGRPFDWVRAVKVRSLGAICIDCTA